MKSSIWLRTGILVTVLGVCAWAAGAAHATTIWAVGYPRNPDRSLAGPVELFQFDAATPSAVAVVGSTNLPENIALTGLDFDAGGNLYAYGRDETAFVGTGLYSINKATGNATLIGGGGLDSRPNSTIDDIAFNPVTGQMLGIGNTGSAQTTVSHFYTINLGTGLATEIGDVVVSAGFILPGGLAVDAAGHVFLFDHLNGQVMELVVLNAVALPNPAGFNSFGILGLTVDWSGDGTMYYGGEENLVPFLGQFRTVDPATGISTLVGSVGPTGIEHAGPYDVAIEPHAVPAPGTLTLFAFGLAGVGFLRRRPRA